MATVIFKATEACNAKCVYCDVVHKTSPVTQAMSPEILEQFFIRVNEFLLERPNESMEVIWHGGEPLLLGPGFFSRAADFQNEHCSKTNPRIRHAMQTNLTLFSSKFTPAFRKLGIRSIGTSYDPVSDVRGLGKHCNSRLYNERFMEAVKVLEREGFGWGVIYVVTKLSLESPIDIFRFLTNLKPTGGITFNPVLLYKRGLEYLQINSEDLVDFLGAIFSEWWRHRSRYPDVEPFTSLTRNLLDGQLSLSCGDAGDCAYSHINIVPNGRVSQCGRAFDWGLLDYGSIIDRSFAQILADSKRDELFRRNQVLYESECKGCRFWPICHGGCPLDAWSETESFMHKSAWCDAKRGFIEKYFEPIVRADLAVGSLLKRQSKYLPAPSTAAVLSKTDESKHTRLSSDGLTWINPIGGLGDTLMIAGILKQVIEKDPSRKFNLVTRTKYGSILREHPAIASIGNPPPGSQFISTNYWDHPDYGRQRAFQILASIFGLEPPVEERLFVPWALEDNPVFLKSIPWKDYNVLVSPSSDSPRKQMRVEAWKFLVQRLAQNDVTIVQAGKRYDRYVRGCYNLLGLTSIREIIALIRHFDVVITSDNFLMHAAHLCAVPAVVLWGPTDHRIYGYPEQIHFRADRTCISPDGCLGPGQGNHYGTKCTETSAHCMNTISVDRVYEAVQKIFKANTASEGQMLTG